MLFDDFRNLTDIQWRRSKESECGLFIAEGATTIERAIELGYVPRSALTTSRWVDSLPLALTQRISPTVVDDDVMQTITGYHVHRGALVSFERKPLPTCEDLISNARTVLVLEDLVDHENVGALLRSAAGMGIDAVLFSDSCADPLYRRSLKVSLGSALSIPFSRYSDSQLVIQKLRDSNFESWALTPRGEVELLSAVVNSSLDNRKIAIFLGTEGDGLLSETLDSCDIRVSIPMLRNTDSLNVATAGAIAMWALTQRGNF